MIRILPVLALTAFSALSLGSAHAADPAPVAPAAAPAAPVAAPALADAVPQRYVVVRGDTLWDISARFLKEPWRWPEIWRMNRGQIKNPHRIYPGDAIVLARDLRGNAYLKLESKLRPKIYEEELNLAIPPIPPNVIEPFIATPLFVEQNTLQSAPRIVATQQDRVFLGKGDTAYVEGADPVQKKWQIFRNGKPIHDPENPEQILGYEAFHLGSATQVKPGEAGTDDPAVFEIDSAKQEIGYGDRLVPAVRPELVDYVPHAPDHLVEGRVASVYGGVGSGGRLSILTINRGANDGLEVGHVLALERNRVVARRDEDDRQEKIVIPALRFGFVFVFRTFDHVSYALAVQADTTIEVNDFIRTP